MVSALPVLLVGLLHGTPAPAQVEPAWLPAPVLRLAEPAHRLFQKTTRRYLLPTLEVGFAHSFSFGWGVTLATLNQPQMDKFGFDLVRRAFWDILYWHMPSYRFWGWNLTHPPIWTDHDGYVVNFLVHGWTGATIHLLYRNHGASVVEGFLFAFLWSLVWEYVSEGAYERPSLNDIMVNTTGALAGEAVYRAKVLVKDQMPPSVERAVILAVLDPLGETESLLLDIMEERLGMRSLVMYLR
jgi:hypothetical protein